MITNQESRAAGFAIHGDTSYALDADGRVHRLKAAVIGARTLDLSSFASYAYIDAEPSLPTAAALLFEEAPKDPTRLRVVLSAGDNQDPLVVLGTATDSAQPPTALVASVTTGNIKVDLLECTRSAVRLPI